MAPRRIITGLFLVYSIVVIRFSNDLLYYQKLVGEGTEASVTNILYDIERNTEFDPTSMQIVVIGSSNKALGQGYEMVDVFGSYPGIGPDGTTITYDGVFPSYLHYVLGRNYSFNYAEDVIDAIKLTDEYQEMNIYPLDGYVDIIDGYLVIRFE